MPTLDRYVTPLKLPMAIDTFWRFPHLPAYKADYKDGSAELTYRPRLSMARLAITERVERSPDGVDLVLLDPADRCDKLAKLFLNAFARVAPVDAMPATTRRHAADSAMRHTIGGGDGTVMNSACFAAIDGLEGDLLGAAIVTNIGLREDEWPESPVPPDLVNLTWLFVNPNHHRRGIGSALLDRVVNACAASGRGWLTSHFSVDNPPAVMFHWRNGFELVGKMGA